MKNSHPSIIDRLGQVMFVFPNPIIEKSISTSIHGSFLQKFGVENEKKVFG